jgi:hypothetical protein
MLVEAVVSASLLVVLSMGFLAALDGAARSSGNTKSRSVASALARDDMERMRALKVSDLANINQTRTQVVGGVTYTIRSTTQWVDDSAGNATCGSAATKTDYLKAVSTVTFPQMGTTQPVKNESLVAIPNGSFSGNTGGLIAKVTDRNGVGVAGVSVTLTGPNTVTGTTDSGGCAYWGALAIGGYYVDVTASGFVDRGGNTTVRRTATVSSGATNSVSFEYDRAATATVNFETLVGTTVQAARGTAISYKNSGMPQGTVTVTAASATSISSGAKLFPFADPYAIWGGSCEGADPRNYGQTTPMATFAPGGAQTVTVRLPALNLRVTKNGTAISTARVRITPATPGCGSTFGGTGLLNANGNLTQPGLPYGDYNVCVDDNNGGSTRYSSTTTPIQNRSPMGTALVTLNIKTSGSGTNSPSGTCA